MADLADPRGGIEFRHLNFRYPDGEYDVLRDVSFTVQPGESVGIVGKTGAGKTALVDLLLRTYNVPDGTLFVDGQDVNSVSIRSVRNACAYVPQDNFLFSDTIAHNIGFGVDGASREDIDHAAAERIILDNLKASRAGKTTLLIAHRISTVEQLDKIIFIEDGRVEAVGPHDTLYRSCAEYRRMVDLQKLEDEAGGDTDD